MKPIRRFISALALVGAMSCGSADETGVSAASLISGAASSALSGQSQPTSAAALRASLTVDVLAQIDTSFIVVDALAIQSAAILSLVETNGGVATYLSGDGVSISLDDGMVVATRGLGFDLMSAAPSSAGRGTAALRSVQAGQRVHTYLDGENQITAIRLQCQYLRDENLLIENCANENYRFQNRYTFDASANLIETKQWISPELGQFTIYFYDKN